jgi:glucokinase
LRIVADFGGTRARLAALGPDGLPGSVREFEGAALPGPAEAVERFLSAIDAEPAAGRELHLAIAIAGPALGENLALTNLHWSFSRSGLRERLGLARLEVLNDFEALARAVPLLAGDERLRVKEGSVEPEAPIAVLGPGTGLGVAALVPDGERFHVIAGEGGHRDLAATDDEEWAIVSRLAARFGHVSAERVLSGPGLENLFAAISPPELAGEGVVGAAEIARRSRAGDMQARRATQLFSSWLGGFAGDLALTLGARGGVYLAGGVLGGLGEAFDVALFRERFLAKGRFRGWLEPIPVWRITRGDAALLGCAGALASTEV